MSSQQAKSGYINLVKKKGDLRRPTSAENKHLLSKERVTSVLYKTGFYLYRDPAAGCRLTSVKPLTKFDRLPLSQQKLPPEPPGLPNKHRFVN